MRRRQATIYTWKTKFGGMDVSEAQRLRALEDENWRPKRLVADLSLDKEMLKPVIAKNGLMSIAVSSYHVSRRNMSSICGSSE